ncbi:Ig-like domain-containing protein [Caenorhabditis elegans]|uniref:Ig-like domain-containing protein n=1 Tax=Caenorhabditis elegans TaxID=6239 RepID=A0A4V0ING2_CAEEL|nr:Ig-like domain-containing protein [Caenorhabditis elegans]VTW47570.1 Ig-like domain-containing protein [Caenorhabditis elegans]
MMKLVLLILGLLIASTSAQIRTKGGTLIAKEGESLTLRCEVEDPSVAIIWRKNTEVVAVDDEILDTYGGYEISMEGSTSVLTIKRVEPINSANYSCALAEPEVSVTFVIKVQVKPLVVISPDTGVYHARVGEKNLVITCHVKEGNPKPGVVWTKQFKAAKLPEDIKREHGGARIVITEVKKHHAGKYNCLAENIAGSDRATIDIHVAEPLQGEREEKPWVKNEDTFIPVRKNQNASFWCTYDGTPVPQVEWLFNGYKINFNDEKFKKTSETAQRLNGYSKSTLTVGDISEEAFGDYACRISNKLGSVTAVVHVSGRPGPPQLSFDESELTWTVRAFDKILEYQLCHRLENADHFLPEDCNSVRVKKSDNNGDDKWTHTIDLSTFLEHGNKYHVQLKARNALGWGSMAKDALHVELQRIEKEEAKGASIISIISSILVTLVTMYLLF